MTYPFTYQAPHTVEDGFGNRWECQKGRPEEGCHMEVVRPGKVQCPMCDAHNNGCNAASDRFTEGK